MTPARCQRFTGTFSLDGSTIAATWEARDPGEEWRLDFHLTYTRIRPTDRTDD